MQGDTLFPFRTGGGNPWELPKEKDMGNEEG